MEPRGTVPRRLTETASAGVQRTQADALNLPGRSLQKPISGVLWGGMGLGAETEDLCAQS